MIQPRFAIARLEDLLDPGPLPLDTDQLGQGDSGGRVAQGREEAGEAVGTVGDGFRREDRVVQEGLGFGMIQE